MCEVVQGSSTLERQIALGRFQGSVGGGAEWRHTAINSLGNKLLGVLYGLSATDEGGWNVPPPVKKRGSECVIYRKS